MKKVAVIGASGIGRHHARWWHLAGADLCAVLGQTAVSNEATVKALQAMFPFTGTAYTDLERMLKEEEPDFVDVCSPPACHYEHVKSCLRHGVHVLCEKPFLYHSDQSIPDLLGQADELLSLAEQNNCLLGLASQHAVTAERAFYYYQSAFSEPLRHFRAELASPSHGDESPLAIWIDLGPHLLAAVQALKVNATPDFSSLSYELSDLSFAVSFNLNCGSDLLPCKLKVSRTVADPAHIRRLTFNDEVVDLEGCRDEDGIYRASYVLGGKSFVEADPLDRLISRMLHEDPVLPAERARENLQWLLAIAEQMP